MRATFGALRSLNSMAKIMLIDATHPEETRVAVVDGRKLEEFDVEVASRRPLKGNIYLAKVTRVEPSLQAAFVEYGGNRHGFLAFSEIHPDYYRIPVADREKLLREAARDNDRDDDDEDVADRPSRYSADEQAEDRGGEDLDAMTSVADGNANEAPFGEDNVAGAGASVAPVDDAGGAADVWHHASEARAASIAEGEAMERESGAAIAPAEDSSPNTTGQSPAHSDPSSSAARAADQLVSPWEQPEGGSAALETPRFELRSAPVDELATAAPGALPSSLDFAPDAEGPAGSAADVMPTAPSADNGNGDAELPAPAEAELVEVQTTAEVVDVVGGEEPAQ